MTMDERQKALVAQPRPKGGETEKITINLGPVDLGQIDLLVEEGFYSNRTDLIRTAIRNQLAIHAQAVSETVTRRGRGVGPPPMTPPAQGAAPPPPPPPARGGSVGRRGLGDQGGGEVDLLAVAQHAQGDLVADGALADVGHQ